MKESRLGRALKQIEIAIRRGFIASLQFRSRIGKRKQPPSLPLAFPSDATILFLRQDRLGDAIISTPVFVELYKKYPKAHFIMLLGENNKGIADLLPIPCEVFIYKKKPLVDIAMLLKLRKRKIEILLDLIDNPSSTSSILAAFISAKHSIGIQKANASSYNITVPLLDRAKYHIARRIIELLQPFGINTDSISLRPQLKNISSQKKKGRIGLVISAGAQNRYVSAETNAKIAGIIISEGFASEVYILYHPKDRKLADDIISKTSHKSIMLAPTTNIFSEYTAQLISCEYIISPDTSALHLCSAYRIPVLGLYAPFPPELHYWTPIDVPFEMIIQEPSLDSLDADNVIVHLRRLIQKVHPEIQESVIA